MALLDRFQALFRPRQQTTDQPATMVTPPPRVSTLTQLFAAERDRRAMVNDCRAMYEEDPRAKGVINTLSRDAVKGGFELRVEGQRAEEAKAIADELLDRVGFWDRVDDWGRLGTRDGDLFLEIACNTQGDIVEVSRKPSLEIYRWTDEFDRFIDPMRAFFWTDLYWQSMEPPPNATFFAEWQMIHARYGQDEGSRYGKPLFASARTAYKRMKEGELDIAIRRKTRAGMKYVHSLEEANESDVEAYKVRNKAALNEPFAAVADFFSNKRTSIQSIQGDARLSEIDDVLHHIRTWWVASPVPMSLLGYGQDLNRDVLDEQKQQYDSVKESMSEWVSQQIVRPLIERQWLLKGIYPDGLDWSVEWASKQPFKAVDLGEAAKALTLLNATGLVTDETLIRLFSRFVPGFDADAELTALEKQKAEQAQQAENMTRVAINAMQRPVDQPVDQQANNADNAQQR